MILARIELRLTANHMALPQMVALPQAALKYLAAREPEVAANIHASTMSAPCSRMGQLEAVPVST